MDSSMTVYHALPKVKCVEHPIETLCCTSGDKSNISLHLFFSSVSCKGMFLSKNVTFLLKYIQSIEISQEVLSNILCFWILSTILSSHQMLYRNINQICQSVRKWDLTLNRRSIVLAVVKAVCIILIWPTPKS